MLDDMAMRAMRVRTQHDYIRHVRAFAAFLGRSPDTATAEDVRRFQLHQREHGAGQAVISAAVSALRFLFTVTLDPPDLARRLVLAPRPRKLPDVLSVEEGKGRKDRNAMLSPQLLELLRLWWREGKRRSVLLPHGWLFPGRSYTDPVSTRQLHRAVCEAADAAGILRERSARWLINWNALAAAVVLTVCSFVDLGALAASWNVRRQAPAAIDLCYLGQVGDGALLPLLALEQRPMDAVTRDRVRYVRDRIFIDLSARQGRWTEWTPRGARRLARAKAMLGRNRTRPLNPMVWRDCSGAIDRPPQPTAKP